MKIRKASEADKENISNLYIASIKKLCSNHYTHEQLNAWTSVLTPSVYDQALKGKIVFVAYNLEDFVLEKSFLKDWCPVKNQSPESGGKYGNKR